jgi:hypothetical protein
MFTVYLKENKIWHIHAVYLYSAVFASKTITTTNISNHLVNKYITYLVISNLSYFYSKKTINNHDNVYKYNKSKSNATSLSGKSKYNEENKYQLLHNKNNINQFRISILNGQESEINKRDQDIIL